jgi:acetyl esterase
MDTATPLRHTLVVQHVEATRAPKPAGTPPARHNAPPPPEPPLPWSRNLGFKVVRTIAGGIFRLAKLHPMMRPELQGVERLRDLRYADDGGSEHAVDVYRPLPDSTRGARVFRGPPWPVVFYAHGGGFRYMSKDSHVMMALAHARRGCMVVMPNYRLAPQHPYPAAIEDICRAYIWTLRHAAELGGDLDRLVVAGESAGANLAASLVLALAYERPEPFARAVFETGVLPRAVVPACGIFQASDLGRLGNNRPTMPPWILRRLTQIGRGYIGPGPWPHGLDLADPVRLLERGDRPARPLPPFFLPVGTRDPLLPDTKRMHRALKRLGAPSQARYYRGQIHAFHAFVYRGIAKQCWDDIFAFLVDRLR